VLFVCPSFHLSVHVTQLWTIHNILKSIIQLFIKLTLMMHYGTKMNILNLGSKVKVLGQWNIILETALYGQRHTVLNMLCRVKELIVIFCYIILWYIYFTISNILHEVCHIKYMHALFIVQLNMGFPRSFQRLL